MSRMLLLTALVCFWTSCSAWPHGAPPSACSTMTPEHGVSETTALAASYSISTSKSDYFPGDKITVTISGNDGALFRGFLVEIQHDATAVGTLQTTFGQAICNQAAVTHTMNDDKSSIQIEWTAPSRCTSDVQVWATIVQTTPVWTIIHGPVIKARCALGDSAVPGESAITATNADVPLQAMKSIELSACGSTKSCFKSSDACTIDCKYVVTWELVDDEIKFEMSGITSGYVALGFSNDKEMGDDNVVTCTSRGMVSDMYQADMSGPSLIDEADPHVGLTSFTGGSDGPGRVSCSFSRKKTAGKGGHVFDLAHPYYLFLASGPIDTNGSPLMHTVIPAVSSAQIDFSLNGQLLTVKADHPLAKAHACLMLIAWVGLGSIGILMARYFKPQWSTTKLCGQKAWFQIHRSFMISAVLLNIIAFLLILAELRWTWSTQVAHSTFGIIVIGLAFIQPIMAFFRPHPDDKNRPAFNSVHWFVGTITHILSALTIFLGMRTPRLYLPNSAIYIMIAFVVWYILVYFILEFNQQFPDFAKKNKSSEEYPMVQKDGAVLPPANTPAAQSHHFRQGIIILHASVTAIFLIAMLAFIIKYPN